MEMSKMRYIIHFCRYHDGTDQNEFHRDDFEIVADGDEDAITQTERLLTEHPEAEFVCICDAFNWTRWERWTEKGPVWEPGWANPIFQH
jgi:hypothetical protein